MNDKNDSRVLIVEDDALVRRAIVRAFVQEGFGCEVVSNGEAALESLCGGRFDIMLSDLRMPEMNGHELIVRTLAMKSPPAILVFTGYAQPKIVRDLLARGVQDVVSKPADYETLALKAKAIVQRRREDDLAALIDSAPASAALSCSPRIVASQVVQVRRSLTAPPSSFDAFREASSAAFGTDDLVAVLQTMPQAAKEVLTLANSVMFQASEERRRLEELRGTGHPVAPAIHAHALAAGALAIGLAIGLAAGLIARF